MKYIISISSPQQQYISFRVELETFDDLTRLALPTWRPGRYELGNFAKNIKSFAVYNEQGKQLSFKKIDSSSWEIDTTATSKIAVVYKYYAAELNAGSTFLDSTQLYVNPVNCFVYVHGHTDKIHEVTLEIPQEWKYAGPLKFSKNSFSALNFDQLADSPFICSESLQHSSYSVNGIQFHVWFNGLVKPNWNKLLKDFEIFTAKQLEKFIEFPTKEYHFLFQILPYATYHGVEHEQCTVITLGPSYAVFKSLYKELLGVSSHELYHTWNVKSIRPAEMLPYDFSKENFSELGYISEGVTTYQGDLMLYRSGVFSIEQYLDEMNTQLQRHFDNFGRFNYSVAESSWDTWLDGYTTGAPGRKVSIYTEGCLLAFITDVLIMRATDNHKRLDDVMRSLYFNFGQRKIGVTEQDYIATIENIAGTSFQWLFDQYHHGTKAYETLLVDSLEYLGIEFNSAPSDDIIAAQLGIKTQWINNSILVKAIYPGCPMDLSGVMLDDEIIGLNEVGLNNDLSQWLEYFWEDDKKFVIKRKGKLISMVIPEMERVYFKKYWLSCTKSPDKNQKNAFDAWSK